jgi:hypothetical protein
MPFLFAQLAAAEKLDRRACSNCDICDNEARMVSGQMIMDGVRQDPESIVEEVDKNENNADEETKLTAGSYLRSLQYTGNEHSRFWIYLTIRLVMMILQNREKFRVARPRTPPPTEDEGLPLAVSSRQEGVEEIARKSDRQLSGFNSGDVE